MNIDVLKTLIISGNLISLLKLLLVKVNINGLQQAFRGNTIKAKLASNVGGMAFGASAANERMAMVIEGQKFVRTTSDRRIAAPIFLLLSCSLICVPNKSFPLKAKHATAVNRNSKQNIEAKVTESDIGRELPIAIHIVFLISACNADNIDRVMLKTLHNDIMTKACFE